MSNKTGFLAKGSLSNEEAERVASLDPRLSRTNYFDGRLLKATDLTRDQIYLDERSREIGRTLGSGIVQGLDLELTSDYHLIVSTGIAVAPSGRVLELTDKKLEANLADYAAIHSYNKGRYRRLKRGLYAVVLCYTEIGTDAAEVYPRDLAEQRKFHFNSYSEGVVLTLVPLRVPLPSDNPLEARSTLARELLPYDEQLPEIPDDGVALGLLAISNERPIWLDLNLVRRPLRHEMPQALFQENLYAHYKELLSVVLSERKAAGLDGDFQASRHFRLLPPVGPLPKAAIAPSAGRQGFFPQHYEVHVAPVRRDEIDAIMRESMLMPPLDLESKGEVEIMVLAPLSDQQFAQLGRRLEQDPNRIKLTKAARLAGFDPLRLRLFPPSHQIDTDANTWDAIWSTVSDDELIYVTRPPRAAETHISGVVLASGYEIPDKLPPPGDFSSSSAALEEARKQINLLELKVKQLRELLKESEGSGTEIESALVKTLEEENKKRQEELVLAVEAKAKLEEQLKEAKKAEEELNSAEDKITEFKAKLAAEKAKSAALDSQLKENSVGIDELRKAKEEAEALKVAQTEKEKQIEALSKEKEELTAENSTNIAALEEERKRLSVLNGVVASKESELAAAAKEKEALMAENSTNISALAEERKKINVLNESLLSKEQQLAVVEKQRVELLATNDANVKILAAERLKVKELQARLTG